MSDLSPIMPILDEDQMDERARAVMDDIRTTRQTDFVNNMWRVLANDPAQMERTWAELKEVMGDGALSPLVKQLIYIAVSAGNGCNYCVRSHTAAARAEGATDEMLAELYAVMGVASKTNALATALQVPVDQEFK